MVGKVTNIEQVQNGPEKRPSSNNKTDVINNETEEIERDRKDFLIFDDYRRRLKRVKPGRLKINEGKNGEKYASIEIKKGDCPEMDEDNGDIKTERNELWLDKECDFEFNKDFKYKFSFKIPENFPLSPTRLVIGQRKYNKIEGSNEKEDPSPILAQRIKKIDGKYYFIITDGTEKKNILGKKIPLEDIKGKRIDMDYEINFSDKKRSVGNNATPSTLKVKAKIEGGKEINIYDGKFNLEEMNNLVLNPKESHTGYFKFGLYRDSYNYTLRKIRDKNDIKEIEQAKESEKQQPTQIYFKNFSMKNLDHEKVEQELNESKKENQQKVEALQQALDEGESTNDEDTSSNSKEEIKGKELGNGQIEQEYAEVLVKLIGNNEKFKELLEGKHELSIKDIENIYNALHDVRSNSKKESLKDGKISEQDFDNLKKFCSDPKAIEKYKMFNCSGGSIMMASIINKLGGQATIASVYHHVVCIAQIGDRQYLIDTINRKWEDISGKGKITDTEYKGVSKFTEKKPLLGMYTEGYIYDSIAQGERYVHGSNYEQMKTEKEYEKAYKEFKDLLGEKLDTYPKTGDEDFPKCILKKNFPEFDKKIYEIEHDKLPKAGFFGKIKLKAQKFFLKLKQFFKKK